MLKKSPLHLMFTFIPVIILLIASAYFITVSWTNYQQNNTFSQRLDNAILLEAYEQSILSESLCMILSSNDSLKIANICQKRIENSQNILNALNQSDDDISKWIDQTTSIKQTINANSIQNFEKLLGKSDVSSIVTSYTSNTAKQSGLYDESRLLDLYARLSDIKYATKLENFLVTYYVTNNIPVPALNTVFWDKVVQASYMLNEEDSKGISDDLKVKLLTIQENEVLQTVMNQIDDVRMTILLNNMTKSSKNVEWIALLDKKLNALEMMEKAIQDKLDETIQTKKDASFWSLMLSLISFIIGILALIFLVFQYKKEKQETDTLATTIHKINAVSAYGQTESDVMQEMLDNIQTKEDGLAYISSSFQLLDEKRRQANDEANSKGQFLSTLSHEIRTPLNGIIGFTKLLRDMGITHDQEELLTLIESSSHNLLAIINDILDLSKMNADKMEIDNVSFDMFELVESTVASFMPQTDQKDIELGVFIDPFLSYYFLGDDTKISQILTNLIGNAVKFTEAYGKIIVFVQSMDDNADSAQIKFAVHDSGIGLTQKQIDNIFNAYEQASGSIGRQYGGTGLGLTISQKMVELMGGKLEVDSRIDHGATFHFTLTLTKDKGRTFNPYPNFSDVKVGLALPVRSIKRQLDTNLEIYMRHLGAKFSLHYYDDLFEGMGFMDLPDIMIFDHHYARLAGELKQCLALDTKIVLLTNGTLHSRINPEIHQCEDILLRPIGIKKCIRILRHARETVNVKEEISVGLQTVESFEGLKVLVADDNSINRKLINIILEKLGLEVTLAGNGEETFDLYRENEYDLIFMDIQMPVMDGLETTKMILEYESEKKLKHVPIIALTANAEAGEKERYLEAGMDDYATKPLDVEKIKSLIHAHCIA